MSIGPPSTRIAGPGMPGNIIECSNPIGGRVPEPATVDAAEAAALLGMEPGPHLRDFARNRGIAYGGPGLGRRGIVLDGRFRLEDVYRVARELAIEKDRPLERADWSDFSGLAELVGPRSNADRLAYLRALGCRFRDDGPRGESTLQVCLFDFYRLTGLEPCNEHGNRLGRQDLYIRWRAEARDRVAADDRATIAPILADRARRRAEIIATFRAAKAKYHADLLALAVEP